MSGSRVKKTKEKKPREKKPAPPGQEELNRSDQGTWTIKGDEPLDKAVSLRLPMSYSQKVQALPPLVKSEWLRKIICEAVDQGRLPEGNNSDSNT